MGQLLFRKRFWEPIARGIKRTTLRRWNRPRLKAGQRAYAPGVGWLMIETVDAIDLGALGEDDARADGFASVSEMLAALREMYPDRRDGKAWFKVRFRLTTRLSSSKSEVRPPRQK